MLLDSEATCKSRVSKLRKKAIPCHQAQTSTTSRAARQAAPCWLFTHKAAQALTHPECIKGPLLVVAAVKQLDGAAHDRHTKHQALQQPRGVRSTTPLQQEQCLLPYAAEPRAASQGAARESPRRQQLPAAAQCHQASSARGLLPLPRSPKEAEAEWAPHLLIKAGAGWAWGI